MRYIKILLVGLIFFYNLAFAAYTNNNDKAICPKATNIKKFRLMKGDMIMTKKPGYRCCTPGGHPYWEHGEWKTTTFFNRYETNRLWEFSMDRLTADSTSQALDKAQDYVNYIEFARGPIRSHFGEVYCEYRSKFKGLIMFVKGR